MRSKCFCQDVANVDDETEEDVAGSESEVVREGGTESLRM